MIIIVGDSWGCGCWTEEQTVYHRGLEQLLHDDGHKVINLSQGGCDLKTITRRLDDHLMLLKDRPPLWFTEPVTKILVLQTEWHRHLSTAKEKDAEQIEIASFYGTLSHISKKYNLPIYVIGGISDTVWLDEFENYYPGVTVVCQSFTNLLVNDDHRTDEPVYSVIFPKNFITDYELMLKAEKGQKRQQVWSNNSQWFCTDGTHPNHLAHEKLYSHLKKENVI